MKLASYFGKFCQEVGARTLLPNGKMAALWFSSDTPGARFPHYVYFIRRLCIDWWRYAV